jgi:hypothetical protein
MIETNEKPAQGAGTTAGKPTDYAGLSRNAFEASKSFFDSAVRTQIDADLRQFYGIHPSGSKYHSDAYKARSKLFRPKTRMAIRKNEAVAAEALFSTVDVISITPIDPENEVEVASADINRELLQYRLTKSIPWFVTSIGAYQDAQNVGVCCSYNYWKYDERKKIDQPCIDLVPVENVRFDPASDWRDVVNTSPYWIHMIPMYVKDVKGRMQREEAKTQQLKWKEAPDTVIRQAMVGYADSTRQLREDKRPDSATADRGVRDFDIVWVYRVFMEIDGQDMVWYCLGNTYHMLTEPVPLEQMYWHNTRPYTFGFCVIETHKVYPGGVSRITKDQQAEINEVANSRIDNVKLAMSKRWKVKRGKQVDVRSLTRNIPNSVTLVTDMEDVEALEFDDVTASSYQEQDRLNLDFDDMAGSFSQSSVQSNRNLNETVGGMNLINTNVNQVSGYQLRVWIETWVEPTLRQVSLLEQYYEGDQVILAIAGKKAKLLQRFGIDAITDELLMRELTINVNVGMSATNPQQQVERFTFGLQKIHDILLDGVIQGAGGDTREIVKEVMGKLGYRDGDRFFPDRSGDPTIEAYEKQIADLQQQLAAKRPPPELTAAQVKKLEAETSEIEQRVQDAMNNPEQDIATEVDAQISDLQKKHDEYKQKSDEQISSLKAEHANRLAEIEQRGKADSEKNKVARYSADLRAKTDREKAQLQAKTQRDLADMDREIEKKLGPLKKRIEVLGEQVKKARAAKATRAAK